MNTNSSPTDIIIVTGPTASGKTELLSQLFAKEAPDFFQSFSGTIARPYDHVEIISADSMQAYRGMDIGTAKPDSALILALPHHLIDIKNPDEQYTAGEFVKLADSLIEEMRGRVLPIISGGTGFYLKNFIMGPPTAPPSDPKIRNQVQEDLQRFGISVLREELLRADPASYARIAYNDIYRLTRALEIIRMSAKPLSAFAPSALPRPGYRFLVLGVERSRQELRERIAQRVEAMFAAGLPAEVERLKQHGYTADSPGMQAIGYREFFELEGSSVDVIKAAITLHTQQYAKRQMTFFKSLPGIQWIQPIVSQLAEKIREFLLHRS